MNFIFKTKNHHFRQILLLCLLFPITLFAQNFKLKGIVIDEKNKPIDFVAVAIENTAMYSLTNEKGEFEIMAPKGKYKLVATMMGFNPWIKEIHLTQNITNIKILMKTSRLQLDNVVVTAKQTQSKEGTSSFKIGENAIKQIQAISLGDMMQLLPGSKIERSNFASPGQIDIRNAGNESGVNAFGTAIIVDGIPLSNDANMQNSLTGRTPSNTANKGIDTREIPASSIESVEVVTGVPSAKYGNITSGAVIVTRKAGASPLLANINFSESTYQGSLSKGVSLPGKWGHLNGDFDYTYAESSPVNRSEYYERYGGGLRLTSTISEKLSWTNTLSANYSYQGNRERFDPEKVNEVTTDATNMRMMASINGSLKVLGTLRYSAGYTYMKQHSMVDEQKEGPDPVGESLVNGTFLLPTSPQKYYQTTTIDGKPRNFYARLEANQTYGYGDFNMALSTGVDYTYDINRGEGSYRAYALDGTTLTNDAAGSRAADYRNLPASTNLAAYEEVDLRWNKKHANYLLRLGGRYDYMNSRYHLFSPRLSASAFFWEKVRLRAAWGLAYKAPSMASLYPGPVYTDLYNLKHYKDGDPDNSFYVTTTHVYEPTNDHLKPSKGETLEVGMDFHVKKWNIRLTAYDKKISNGITTHDLMMPYQVEIYQPGPAGNLTAVIPTGEYLTDLTMLKGYANSSNINTQGLEFVVDPPTIEATKTSFQFSGNVTKSTTYSPLPDLRERKTDSQIYGKRVGKYEASSRQYLQSRANLTIIQHIPKLGLLATFITELNFIDRNVNVPTSLLPMGFFNKDGEYTDMQGWSAEDFDTPEYRGLVLDEVEAKATVVPFYPNFHLQLRKETKHGHSFSFFANNCLWYNPTYQISNSNSIATLNNRITFGFGMTIKIN